MKKKPKFFRALTPSLHTVLKLNFMSRNSQFGEKLFKVHLHVFSKDSNTLLDDFSLILYFWTQYELLAQCAHHLSLFSWHVFS